MHCIPDIEEPGSSNMRAVIIFTLLFYSLVGFIITKLPTPDQAEGFNIITEADVETVKVQASEAPSPATAIVVAGLNLFAVIKTIYLLLSFQLSGVPFLINLLFLIPANITVYMVAVQLVRGS